MAKYRKSIWAILLSISMSLAGCRKNENVNDELKEGIYYPKLSESLIGQVHNPYASTSKLFSCLHYDDKIYTTRIGLQITDKNELLSVVDEKLCAVSGYEGTWSIESDELAKITDEGTLYQIQGYDEEFRVAVYYETNPTWAIPGQAVAESDKLKYLLVFEYLNDITLNKGNELYAERYQLEESICVEASLAGEYTVSCEFAGEDEKVQNLIGAMFEGTFISGVEKAYTNLDYQEAYHLTFYDKHNLPLELNVYEEGYVVKSDLGKDLTFVLQVDAQACKEFIEYINEACNEKVIENTF